MALSENRILRRRHAAGITGSRERGIGIMLGKVTLTHPGGVGNGQRSSIMLTGKPKDLGRTIILEGNTADGMCTLRPDFDVPAGTVGSESMYQNLMSEMRKRNQDDSPT